jgi:peptidoglycan/xylan/chitin deacetylase (PgdA/CDA1 family)
VEGLSAFLHPVADQWRDVVLRAIFHAANRQRVPVQLLWLYPRNLPALGHISHDTDGNDPSLARMLLDVLGEADIRSTWCVILPGYAPELIESIRSAGHELAIHYDAMTPGCDWGKEIFDLQWARLCEMFGTEKPVTNKNHYLRWEGDTEFFEWCVARGIRVDQSKGASKTGEAGFNFGTCHPYRPVSPDSQVLNIHELPTLTQDLNVFAPDEIAAPLLDAALTHYGILHLLFHPAHIAKPSVSKALIVSVRKGRDRGIEWWTARDISRWERARRSARWAALPDGTVTLTAGDELIDATTMVLLPGNDAGAGQNRWGFSFKVNTRTIAAGETVRIKTNLQEEDESAGDRRWTKVKAIVLRERASLRRRRAQ